MAKKYDTKAHSEVLEAVQSGHIKPGRTLDLGCGHGRNALYLASLGHEVTAVDINNEATQRIQMIADEESYNVRAATTISMFLLFLSLKPLTSSSQQWSSCS